MSTIDAESELVAGQARGSQGESAATTVIPARHAEFRPLISPLVVAAAFLSLMTGAVLSAWMSDDAFITLRTVKNFVEGHGLTWNDGERVQAFTHPLWMFVLSAAFAFTREPYFTTIAISLVLTAAAALVIVTRIGATPWSAALALFAMSVSNAVVDYATSGLENALSFLLVVSFLAVAIGERRPARLVALAGIACLATLNRMDTLLILGPLLIVELWQARRQRGAVFAAALMFLPFVAWEIFSVFYYGFLFPNTAYAKLNTGIPSADFVRQGFLYLTYTARNDVVTLVLIGAGGIVAVASRNWRQMAVALGVALYLVYTVRIGGDFMAGRFFAVPAFACAGLLARWPLGPRGALAVALIAGTIGVASPHPTVIAGGSAFVANQHIENGIVDERGIYLSGNGLINVLRHGADGPYFSWRSRAVVMRAAAIAGDGPKVHVMSVIGMFGYYGGRDLYFIDQLALADAFLARLPLPPGKAWRIGHFERKLPVGYVESRTQHVNRLLDPELRRAYDAIELITSAPLLSRARLRAIWDVNRGVYAAAFKRTIDAPLPIVLAALATPVKAGTPWLCDRCVQMDYSGVIINVGALSHAPSLSIALDHNDDYEIRWLKDGKIVGTVALPAPNGDSPPGMYIHHVPSPPDAVTTGFDAITITPHGGDQLYSVGHLLLLDDR